MIRVLYKEEQSLQNKRLLTMIGLMFFLIKRFSDIVEWRWELTEFLEGGAIRVLQRKSKTDQQGAGV